MNLDRFALAAWNAANARARDDYFALRLREEGICVRCAARPRYAHNAMCLRCMNIQRIIREGS